MPLQKDDIDGVSITLRVHEDPAFLVMLTRGGLTKRLGASDAPDPSAVLITGRTDGPFETLLAAIPEALLAGEGGSFEDGGTLGPRYDWRFEFGGGLHALVYDVSYHAGSASLPDEFADLVVLAERLTHSWYAAMVAEESGAPLPAPTATIPPPPPPRAAQPKSPRGPAGKGSRVPSKPGSGARPHGASGAPVPATRERIALAVLLDLFALSVPFAFLYWMVVGSGERVGPPGGGLILFALAEFILLFFVRRSPGYALLGITAPHGEPPQVDPARLARDSKGTLGLGIGLCALGALGVTSWTFYRVPVPYFGLAIPLWLSLPISVVGSAKLAAAGALVLRGDVKGVLLAGGIALGALLSGLIGWPDWGPFVDTAVAAREAYLGRPLNGTLVDLARMLVPPLVVALPALALAGVYEGWRRLAPPGAPFTKAAAARS